MRDIGAALEDRFVEFLQKQGYPQETIRREWFVYKRPGIHPFRLDIAIVLANVVIQAFEIKANLKGQPSKTQEALRRLSSYSQPINSANITDTVLIVTYDDADKNWYLYSLKAEDWVLAKDELNFQSKGQQFVENVKSLLLKQDIDEEVSVVCKKMSYIGLVYLCLYIIVSVANSSNCITCTLPLTSEMLILYAIIVLVALFPEFIKRIKKISVNGFKLELVENELKQYPSKK